jgi:ABC-2 type transport system permease protein
MKYIGLWFNFLKISWMAEAEYRLNMFVRVFSDVIWYFSQITIFEVLFYHVPRISGWDIQTMRVFMGILFMIDATYMILFHDNFENAPSLVRKGELDFILLKPMNSQFMFSCRKVNAVYSINLVIVAGYLIWAIHRLPQPPALMQYPLTLALMASGLGVLYSLRFLFAALNVILTNAGSLTYVWYQFYRLGNRPHALYPSWLRWCLLTIFPVGLIVSVPATNLVGRLETPAIWLSPIITLLLLYITTRYWNFVLKFYSSASS